MNILLISLSFIIAFVIIVCYEYKIRNLSVKPKNNVHFYVARDPDGSLWLHLGKPFRKRDGFYARIPDGWIRLSNKSTLKYFGLNEKDYINLKWEDEPVEVFINMKD